MSALALPSRRSTHVRAVATRLRELHVRFAPPLSLFLISRAALAVLMWWGPSVLPGPRRHLNPSALPDSDILHVFGRWTIPWFRFDARWYAGVVEHGYHWGRLGEANTNFMPLFPAVARAVEPLTGGSPWIATWAVANLACLLSVVLLWEWGTRRLGRRRAMLMTLLFLSYPFGFFFSAPYAEPLFLALAVGAFLAAEEGRWPAAIVLAGAASITRPVGVAVVVGIAVLALQRREVRSAPFCAAALAPLAGFVVYLTLAFGHPLAFMTYHTSGWVAPHGGVLATVSSQFHTPLSPFDRVDVFLSLVFLASVPAVWRRVGPAYAVYSVIAVALPLVHGLAGMERYVSVVFPVFAAWTAGPRWAGLTTFAVCLAILPLAVAMYAAGYTIT